MIDVKTKIGCVACRYICFHLLISGLDSTNIYGRGEIWIIVATQVYMDTLSANPDGLAPIDTIYITAAGSLYYAFSAGVPARTPVCSCTSAPCVLL